MKRLLLLALILLQLSGVFALVVRLQSWNIPEDIATLNKLQLSVDNVNAAHQSIIVYLRDYQEYDLLKANGFDPTILPDPYELFLEATAREPETANRYQYYTMDEYNNFMQTTAANYPEICLLQEWGRSVQNRPLYAMKISDNVQVDENEPEVKLIASIHGDEPVGYDMMIRLIKLCTEEYLTNPRITGIVNNTELWILPLMNPDGYVNHVRYNYAGVDLNRNFPMPYPGLANPDGYPHAPETQAMMNFSLLRNFVLGINFHGGALVVNYPWDYTYTLAPDDALLIDLALCYSSQNLPMYNSYEFAQGITNGAAWYPITGSMQDWNYAYTNNIELTAEIGNNKWPAASTLDAYWQDNKESILSYIEYVQRGVKGTVYNSLGAPIAHFITIDDEDAAFYSFPHSGDYHRVLLPGTYTVKASRPGYISQSAQITVPAEGYVVQDFTLQAADLLSLTGTMRDLEGFPHEEPIGVFLDGDLSNEWLGFGIWEVILYEGDYQMGYLSATSGYDASEISVRTNPLAEPHALVLLDALIYDNFDAGMDNWHSTGAWGTECRNGIYYLTDSPNGNYANNSNNYASLAQPVDLSDVSEANLFFSAIWDLEINYDYVYLEVSNSGSNWQELDRFTGTMDQDYTNNFCYDLSDYIGGNLYLRFRLKSDRSSNADGIRITNFKISARPNGLIVHGDLNGDKIISRADMQFILNHICGENLPDDIIQQADLNDDGIIDAVDAAMLYLYCLDPYFRFPVQSGEIHVFPEPVLNSHLQGNALYLTLSNPEDINSIQISGDSFSCEIANLGATKYAKAENPQTGDFVMIGSNFPAQLIITFDQNPVDLHIQLWLNGHPVPLPTTDNAFDTAPQYSLQLMQNYPNPFNPVTNITFSLPASGAVSLEIYNLKGQKVSTLIDQIYPAGKHQLSWNATDSIGQKLASGIYFYILKYGEHTLTRKMVLSK